MTNFEIAKKYMAKRYPSYTYAMREGNDCVWITIANVTFSTTVEMYLTIRNGIVVDVLVD